MSGLPKGLIVAGVVLIILGLGMHFFRLGRLPGDFVFRGQHTTVYLPIMTSIVLSIVLSLVFYIFSKFR